MTTSANNVTFLGMVWIDNQQRPYYGHRDIKRGKQKGWVEVLIMKATDTGPRIRKIKVESSCLRPLKGEVVE